MKRQVSSTVSSAEVSRELDNTTYDVVKKVSDNIVEVVDVGNAITEVITVSTNIAAILALIGIETPLLSLYADKVTLDSLYADKATLDSIFADKAKLDSLFADKAKLDSLYADKITLDRLHTSIANIDTVALSIANVDIVGAAISNVNATGSNIASVNTVATDIVDVSTIAANIADVNTVADGMVDISNYADTYYGSLAVAPTIGSHPTLSEGDLYFDTVLVQLRVYDGSIWTAAGSTVNGIDKSEQFIVGTPSGIYDGVSSTVFPLVGGYDAGFAVVYLNGYALADSDIDITSSISVTLVGITPAIGDIVKVVAFGAFVLADHYTKAEVDNKLDINSYTAKTTPVDADELALADSAATFSLKKLTWANLKATLKTYFDTLYAKFQPTIATGSATFTNSTNNIALTGIGIGVEVGDVIVITGSVSNNKEFTVEVITDANNVIVNQAHEGGTTTKSLVNETATVTAKLLSKWNNAPSGLGQGYAVVTASRASVVTYTNTTGKPIMVNVIGTASTTAANSSLSLYVDGVLMSRYVSYTSLAFGCSVSAVVNSGSTYYITINANMAITNWIELR